MRTESLSNYNLIEDLMRIIKELSIKFQITLSHDFIAHETNYRAIKFGNCYNENDMNEIITFLALEKAKIERLIFKMIEIGIVDKNGNYIGEND